MLNLKETEEQKIYISSDFHLNHNPKRSNPIWNMRGFSSAIEMTDGIIQSVNDTVRTNDILLFLGDFCLNTTLEQFDALLGRFNCQNIYCLWGNHNNPHEKKIYRAAMATLHPEHTELFESETYPFKYKNVTYVGHYMEVVLNGQFTVLMHYPISVWNEQAHGAWMLCGHSHYGFEQTKASSLNGKILDVGWDGHRKPWSLSEIAFVMKDKQFVPVDHHHK